MRSDFIRVAKLGEVPKGGSKRILVGDLDVALWDVEGNLFAVANLCAHQHFPTMHQARRDGSTITCPMHGWSFSLESGRECEGKGKLATYPVKIEGDDILVDVSASAASWG
jgi:3-phenylpropionate/trans-cinnamate dioxygenase ferredoxin subunit